MNDHPEDLGIKIGSPEEKAWTTIKERAEEEIKQMQRSIILNEACIAKAVEMIEKEKL